MRCRIIAQGGTWNRKTKKHRKMRYSYKEYIFSREWLHRRSRYYKKHGRQCAICQTSQHIHLHHMKYTTYDGTEPDENLVPLCETHHDAYHLLYGVSGNMIRTTSEFIEDQRQLLQMQDFMRVA